MTLSRRLHLVLNGVRQQAMEVFELKVLQVEGKINNTIIITTLTIKRPSLNQKQYEVEGT